MNRVQTLLRDVAAWASSTENVIGLALVGSHARGEARPDSDIDLVLLSEAPADLLETAPWSTFGEVSSCEHGDYGPLQSNHVFYRNGLEVEFGVTSPAWARAKPVDPGTRRVVADGMRVLYDPQSYFGSLQEAVSKLDE